MSRRRNNTAMLLAGLVVSRLFASSLAIADDATAGGVAIAKGTTWSLRIPADERVAFRGVVSFDDAGTGSNSFLYPAPSAGGFLAAVITHGVIVDSTKRGQKEKLQTAADNVLSPYRGVIDGFDLKALSRRAVAMTSGASNAHIIVGTEDAGEGIVVESQPVYSMTQDQKAIILDNAITIHGGVSAPENTYRKTVRVVSKPREEADPTVYWTANSGDRLSEESAKLLAQSLEIALMDSSSGADMDGVAYRTIRYLEGGAEKIERAQVLRDRCGRLLLRNLRGALMSVPTARVAAGDANTASCTQL